MPSQPNAKLISDQSALQKISLDAASAPSKAAARMGGAISGIGKRGISTSQKIQKATNDGEMADARRQMREYKSEFMRDKLTNLDESEWLDKWQEGADMLQRRFEQNEYSPEVRRNLEIEMADFRSRSGEEIQTQALQQSLTRAQERQVAAADQALIDGDLPSYEREVDSMNILPEAKERMKKDGRRKFTFDVIKSQNMEDPAETINQLDRGDYNEMFTEADRKSLRSDANKQLDRLKGEEAKMIYDSYEDGMLPSENDILSQVENSEYLDEKDGELILKNIRKRQPVTPDESQSYQDRIDELSENSQTLSKEAYGQRYWELQKELQFLGSRVGAEKLRRSLGGISEDNLMALEGSRQKTRRDKLFEKSRSELRDIISGRPDKDTLNSTRSDVQDAVEIWLDMHPDPDKVTSDEIRQKTKEFWQQKTESPDALTVAFGDIEINASSPLLPPKP